MLERGRFFEGRLRIRMAKNKFDIKFEQTHDRLVRTGMELLCEKGYAAASISDIAERAGVTKGAFYVHFKSKEDFFFQMLKFRVRLREDWPKPEPPTSAANNLKEAIVQRLNVLYHYLNQYPEWIMVYVAFFLQERGNPRVRELYEALGKEWAAEYKLFLDELVKEGWISADVETERAAIRWFRLMDGNILHYNLYGKLTPVDDLANMLIALLKD